MDRGLKNKIYKNDPVIEECYNFMEKIAIIQEDIYIKVICPDAGIHYNKYLVY